jgi:glycosyltransferase involved in cell wall biosynthesis
LISRLNAVIALSHDIERALVEGGVPEEKVVYIPNCVDTSRFRPAESAGEKSSLKEELGLGDEPVIAFVGELTERKRAHLLLQALSELHDFRIGWQLVLAGPANDEAYARRLVSYVDEQGWRNRVHFLGHVRNIEDVYKAGDIFCLPSQDEGMPGALLEAMVSRTACIVTPFSGAYELIKDGMSGRVVPPSPSAIAGALRDYLCDEHLRTVHGAAARQVALARYSTEKVLQDHIELFYRLQASRTPRLD